MADDGRIVITYGLRPHPTGGFLPILRRSQHHRRFEVLSSRALDEPEALALARAAAAEEASHFVGDWQITIQRTDDGRPKQGAGAASCAKVGPLSAAERRALPPEAFGIPERRAYPMPSASHARNALARVAQAERKGTISAHDAARVRRKADAILAGCAVPGAVGVTHNPGAPVVLVVPSGQWRDPILGTRRKRGGWVAAAGSPEWWGSLEEARTWGEARGVRIVSPREPEGRALARAWRADLRAAAKADREARTRADRAWRAERDRIRKRIRETERERRRAQWRALALGAQWVRARDPERADRIRAEYDAELKAWRAACSATYDLAAKLREADASRLGVR